ncbi:hypothetical protein DFH11DRAFT_1224582 [Phellopilus nigrolimitatus]|nr:hypothetical protein DFH11DRAFT_1224582 [Phellopilus nigrolimitatus]
MASHVCGVSRLPDRRVFREPAFSARTKRRLSACVRFPCRTPSEPRSPEVARSRDQVHIQHPLRHPLPCDTPRSAGTSRRRHVLCTLFGSRTWPRARIGQSSQQSASFYALSLLPLPSSTGLTISAARVVPAKRSHRSRCGCEPDELFNGECEKT